MNEKVKIVARVKYRAMMKLSMTAMGLQELFDSAFPPHPRLNLSGSLSLH